MLLFCFDFRWCQETCWQQGVALGAIFGIGPDAFVGSLALAEPAQGIVPGVDNLYLYHVLALLQYSCNLYLIGGRPGDAAILAVYPHVGDVLHIREGHPSATLRHLLAL